MTLFIILKGCCEFYYGRIGKTHQITAPGLTSPMKQNGNGMVYPMNRNFVFGLDFTF